MVIGLVISSSAGYSETFFKNKIRLLTDEGIKVVVFADKSVESSTDYELIKGFSWEGSLFAKANQVIAAAAGLLFSPLKAWRLYSLNSQSIFSLRKNILSLLSSAHILKFELDWINFGFATSAIGRENLAKAMGIRMAVSVRGFDMAIYPQKHPGCYELLWNRLDKLHYLSDDLLSLAVAQGFDVETPHQKITPAIDLSLFCGKSEHSFADPIKIVTVARLHWIKGLEYTIEALGLLKQKRIDFEYTIVGEGKEQERLVFAAKQSGIQENICFAGRKSPEEVKQILQSSDVYLQYSIHEGFSNAVLEAQAVGLLCIVSDGGGLSENVLHERTGWVVAHRDPKALAEQLIKVINLSESARVRISQAAKKRVKEKFNLKKQRKEFEIFYEI